MRCGVGWNRAGLWGRRVNVDLSKYVLQTDSVTQIGYLVT